MQTKLPKVTKVWKMANSALVSKVDAASSWNENIRSKSKEFKISQKCHRRIFQL